ncbi:hypothetical protein P9112_002825 [Eukaryota sp. TZLM1-RC]
MNFESSYDLSLPSTIGVTPVDDSLLITSKNAITLWENGKELASWMLEPGSFTEGFTVPCTATSSDSVSRFWAVVDGTKIVTWLRIHRNIPTPVFTCSSSVVNIHPYTSGIVCSLSTNQLIPISTDYVDNPLPMESDVISLNLPCTTNNSLISSFSVFYHGSPYILTLSYTSPHLNLNFFHISPILEITHASTASIHFPDYVSSSFCSSSFSLCLVDFDCVSIFSLSDMEPVKESVVHVPFQGITLSFGLSCGSFVFANQKQVCCLQFGNYYESNMTDFGRILAVSEHLDRLLVISDQKIFLITSPKVQTFADLFDVPSETLAATFTRDDIPHIIKTVSESGLSEFGSDYLIDFINYCIDNEFFEIVAFIYLSIPDLPVENSIKCLLQFIDSSRDEFPYASLIDWSSLIKRVFNCQSTNDSLVLSDETSFIDPSNWWANEVVPILEKLGIYKPQTQNMEESIVSEIQINFDRLVLIFGLLNVTSTPKMIQGCFTNLLDTHHLNSIVSFFNSILTSVLLDPYIHSTFRYLFLIKIPKFLGALIDSQLVNIGVNCDANILKNLSNLTQLVLIEGKKSMEILGIMTSSHVPISFNKKPLIEKEFINLE